MAAPLLLAHGVVPERRGVIIRIVTDNGLTGWGEAAPLAGFSPDTLETTIEMLTGIASSIKEIEVHDSIGRIGEMVREIIPGKNPAAVFGLETALCDLAAQASGKPLSAWLAPKPLTTVAVNYLLAGTNNDWTKVKSEFEGGGYKTVKIKVGGGSPEDDIAVVRKFRRLLGDDIAIRLDANRRWSFDTAVRVLGGLRGCRIDYVEEPLAEGTPSVLGRLKAETGARIALDESLAEVGNIEEKIALGGVDVLIVKPTVLGGIVGAMQLAEMARRYDRQVVITSTFESEIGLTALVHLAAAVCAGPAVCTDAAVCTGQVACGLNTMSVFEEILVPEFLIVNDGGIRVPQDPGLGLPAGLQEMA